MPTVITFLDDSIDMSIFYSISDEEKDNKQEKNKDIDFVLLEIKNTLQSNYIEYEKEPLEQGLSYYTKPHIKRAFPPPKLIF